MARRRITSEGSGGIRATYEGEARPEDPAEPDVVAREGDVLVVQFPEAKVGIPGSYSSVGVGGLTYSRKLLAGDCPEEEYNRIFSFLRRVAERDGEQRVREFTEELNRARKSK